MLPFEGRKQSFWINLGETKLKTLNNEKQTNISALRKSLKIHKIPLNNLTL